MHVNVIPQNSRAEHSGAQGNVNLQDQASQCKSVSFELVYLLPQDASSEHSWGKGL